MLKTLLLPMCLALGATSAQAAAPTEAALRIMAEAALARVEAMRGQRLGIPLKMSVKSKPQVTAFIMERLNEEYGPARVAAEGTLLKLQGLLPPTLAYQAFITDLLTEQVAGFYDHTRKELHIASWLPTAMQEPVMAHEIFHAIQDHAWGGGKLIDSKLYTHDTVLAHAALLEGDATIVMFNDQQRAVHGDVTTSPMTLKLIATSLPLQMSSPQFPIMASAPDYLKQSFLFPYQQGLLFIGAVRNAGMSWPQVNAMYRNPPHTTEQILHPERFYPTRDRPSEVRLPVMPGFEQIWEGTTGEFHARQLLMAGLPVTEAIAGAAGWDGDMTVVQTAQGQAVALCLSTWDSTQEAVDFHDALRARKAGPANVHLVVSLRGREVAYAFSKDNALAKRAVAFALAKGKVTPH